MNGNDLAPSGGGSASRSLSPAPPGEDPWPPGAQQQQQLPQPQADSLPKVISEEFLTCKICFETFSQPKILDCLHSFCASCLEHHARQNQLIDVVPCPLCRQPTPIPNGISDLRDNFFIANLQDAMATSGGVEGEARVEARILCDSCRGRGEEILSHMKCLDCDEFLCDQCIDAHQRLSVTKNHQMALITADLHGDGAVPGERGGERGVGVARRVVCRAHPEEECRLYCADCKQLICVTCRLTSHEGHTCCGFEQAALQEKEKLAKSLLFVKSRIALYEGILKDWKHYKGDLDRQKQALQSKIDVRRRELHALVDGWHYAMTQQLEATSVDERKHISAKIDLVEVHLETNCGMCGLAEDILKNSKETQFLSIRDQLETDFGRLQRENINAMCLTQKSVLSFNVGNQSLNFDHFGAFMLSHEKVLSSVRLKPVQCVTFVRSFQTRQDWAASVGSRYDASAITLSPRDEVVITDRHVEKIVLFSVSGEKKSELNISLMGRAVCAVVTGAGQTVFSRDKQNVCVFDDCGRHKLNIKENLSKPSSLALSADQSHIYILDYEQKLVTKLDTVNYAKVSHVKLNYKKSCIWDKIAVTSQGNIYLSACNESCIYEFTPSGQRLVQYGRLGSTTAGDLYWQRGMCVDAHDNLIVADTNNDRLQLMSPQGTWTLLQPPEDHPLRAPTDVAVDSTGKLFVLEKCGSVHVMEYLPY